MFQAMKLARAIMTIRTAIPNLSYVGAMPLLQSLYIIKPELLAIIRKSNAVVIANFKTASIVVCSFMEKPECQKNGKPTRQIDT